MGSPIVLGIETSCDETGIGLVELPSLKIRANILASQVNLHAPYYGVVPELASRAHLEKIIPLIEKAAEKARVDLQKISAVAYTRGPGLKGSLLIGENTAKALALLLGKPVIGAQHLEAHLAAVLFDHAQVRPPFLGLVVSGGHSDLVIVENWGCYKVLGRTLDDACGEALDKFAKMLKLGYPGGSTIDRLAKKGDPQKINFPRPTTSGSWDPQPRWVRARQSFAGCRNRRAAGWDFSFSGLKTSALYWLRDNKGNLHESSRETTINDLAASFQEAICETLLIKATRALKHFDLKTLVVCGGVAANSRLRFLFNKAAKKSQLRVFFPRVSHCTDNGVMVALAGGLRLLKQGKKLLANEFRKNVDTDLAFLKW